MRAVALVALLILAPAVLAAQDAPAQARRWTSTDPPVNLVHIEHGEINRHGEAVGYHHRPNSVDPPDARLTQVIQPPDASGVYRARVTLHDPTTGGWIDKKAPSTFFPDAMSVAEVVGAILTAYRDGRRRGDGQFIGASGRGFTIEGWYQNGHINSAYPLRGP